MAGRLDRTFGAAAVGRGNNFDAIRFALAALVILSHSYPLLLGNNAGEPFMVLTGGQTTGGELAVGGFFALSGFLIAQSWQRSPNVFGFFRKRILRIYPGFLAAVLFGTFVVAPRIASDTAAYWNELSLKHLTASALNLDPRMPRCFNDLPIHAVNGSLWSIRYEFLCYVGISVMGLLGALRHRWAVGLAFSAALSLQAGQLHLGWELPGGRVASVIGGFSQWPRLGALFLSGTLAYLYRDRIENSPRGFALAALALLLGAAFSQLHALPLLLPIFGTYLLLCVGFLPMRGLQQFAAKGDISYGLYLYAFPVQQWLVHQYGDELTPAALFAAALPITILLAAVSWRCVERPFLVRRQRPAPEPIPQPATVPHSFARTGVSRGTPSVFPTGA